MNKKQLLPLAALLLLVGGLTWAVYTGIIGGMPGRLYKFYPASTGFYLEMQPGKHLSRRLLNVLQTRLYRPQARQAPQATGKAIPKADAFQAALLARFNSVFEPYFSLGVWPEPQNVTDPEAAEIMVAFPLKRPDMTFSELVGRFKAKPEDFKAARHAGATYYVQPDSQSALAVLEGNLLITNTPQAMQRVLTQHRQQGENVFENPLNRQYLAKLTRRRDGVFILNNTVYSRQAMALKNRAAGGRNSELEAVRFAHFSQIVPLSVGNIHVRGNEHLAIQSISPILLENINNPNLREDLRKFYRSQAPLNADRLVPQDTALLVEIAGLPDLFSVYNRYFMGPRHTNTVKSMAAFLKLVELDFHRDIIGLLQGEAVIAARPMQPFPVILLEKTPDKLKTIGKLAELLTKSGLPIEQKTEQVGRVEAQTLMLPRRNLSMSYGFLDGSIAFGPTTDFARTVKVGLKEEKSLAQSPAFDGMMRDFPRKANVMLYVDLRHQRDFFQQQLKRVPAAQSGASTVRNNWVDALSAAFWVKQDSQNVDLLEGRLNLRLKPESARR